MAIRQYKISKSHSVWSSDLLGVEIDLKVTCSDNECGLGEEQANAFLTQDTSYKDDLTI
jgi:hypothetical protein